MERIFWNLVLAIFIFGCNNQQKKLNEIRYLSQIEIPLNSEILNYHDNLETSVVYKIKINKNQLKDFITETKFIELDTVRSNYLEYHDILNSFVIKEKIFGDNLKICQKHSTSIILNEDESVIWGITNYPVDLPDSISIKKPY